MTDDDQPEFTHTAEDYSALDGKDLPPEMVEDILKRAQLGLPLAPEQSQALGCHPSLQEIVLLPKDPQKVTKQQVYAMSGGEDATKRKSNWFQWELIVINIEAMIKEGKTEHINEDGSRLPLDDLLTDAKHQRDMASRLVDE